MDIEAIKKLFLNYKENSLSHRYITNSDIELLLEKIKNSVCVETIGESVLGHPIYGLKIGRGDKRILMWSQMHGNESTTTKALFDLFNTLLLDSKLKHILNTCTLYIIPILNPDGALAYTRINANKVDLNRDAQDLTQPESIVLRKTFETFKPHFCYNLHGQRTIFSAGKTSNSATVSFLAPAQDKACTVTENRKIAMEVIGVMNKALQKMIPNSVGVYDDAFNLNCVGDTFQSEHVPTILFEAGHYANDYAREKTRELIYVSYLASLDYISKNEVKGDYYDAYYEIPENDTCFLDVIIRNAKVDNKLTDIGIQFQEQLKKGKIEFIPRVEKIEKLNGVYAHNEIDANGLEVLDDEKATIKVGSETLLKMLKNKGVYFC